MSLVYPNIKTPTLRTWGTVNLSTNADGITNSDVLDCGGLTVSCIALSSLAGSSCYYTFYGSPDSSGTMQQLISSSGTTISMGTTLTSSKQATFIFDPSQFCGIRFFQMMSMTTAAPNSNSPGATARIGLSAFGLID